MLEPTSLVFTDFRPSSTRFFARGVERTEAANLLIFRLNDEVRRVLRADNGNAAGHAFDSLQRLSATSPVSRTTPTASRCSHHDLARFS